MELRQLRYFVAIAQEGSLSKAASKVHIAQPALSRQIQMLEEELDVELLLRTTRGVELTAAGLRFLQMAESIVQAVAHIKPALQGLGGVPAGDVSVGISPSLIPVLAEPLMAECARQYPLVKLHVVEGLSMFLAVWLEQSRLDLAVYTARSDTQGVEQEEIAQEEVVVVGTRQALDNHEGCITPADLVTLPLVLTPAFRSRMRPRLEQGGVQEPDAREIDSVATVKQMALQGTCCSVLPYSFVHDEVARGQLVALHFSGTPLLRRIVMATRANSTPSPAARRVGQLVRDIVDRTPRLAP